MKRIIALLLTVLFVFSLAACSNKDEKKDEKATEAATEAKVDATEAEPISGGWTDAKSPVITPEIKAMFDKLNETMTGAQYVPVALLQTQVVAGTNYRVLCKEAIVLPDAVTTYSIVTVYEDLEGKAEITDVQNSDVEAPSVPDPENPMTGAYTEPESPEVTADAKAALEKALEALDGASYEPVALLGTQVVSGTNYLMLCKIHMITANASPDDFHYSFVTVYQDLEGDASIIETKDIGASDEESGAEPEPVEYDAISDSSQAE